MRFIASAIKGATDKGRTLGEMRTASVGMIESGPIRRKSRCRG